MTGKLGRVTPFWGALVAIVLVQVAWATALPGFRGPDEIEHVKRASAVASGEMVSSATADANGHQYVSVERDLSEALHGPCIDLHRDLQPESCEPAADDGPGRVLMPSTAAGYVPAYYLLVAPASWLLEGEATLWGIRVIGAAVSALLLAWAWSRRARTARSRWQGVGLMLCLSPAVTFASAVGAPNGIHLAAALLLWVGLVTGPGRGSASFETVDPGRGKALGVSVVLMVLTHALGILWLTCALVVLGIWQGRQGVRRLRCDLYATPWTTAAAVSAIATVVCWSVLVPTNDVSVADPLAASTKEIPAFAHAIVWVFQVVGTMPYRFGLVWPVVYALWIAAVVAHVWSGLRVRDRRTTLAVVGTITIAAAVPVMATVLTYDELGFAWQGRYGLPLLFAVPLVVAEVTRGVLPRIRHSADVLVGTAGLALCLTVACLALREAVASPLAVLAVSAAAAGWCGAWWVLRCSVAPEPATAAGSVPHSDGCEGDAVSKESVPGHRS